MSNINNGERNLWNFQNDISGGFYKLLFQTIAKADEFNRARLKIAYPEEVEAYERYQNEPGYWEKLDAEIRRKV